MLKGYAPRKIQACPKDSHTEVFCKKGVLENCSCVLENS